MQSVKSKGIPGIKKFLAFFFLLLLTLILFIKPLTIYLIQTYLSSLLETPVKVQALKLSSLDVQASIKEDTNIANIKINTLFPLDADIRFEGNIDAFKAYHPLKAQSELLGNVYYKDSLIVKAELFSMGAKAKVNVTQEGEDWAVDANISHLDLAQLQMENNLSLQLSGRVAAEVDFHSEKNSFVKVTSDKVTVHEKTFEDVSFDLKAIDDDMRAYAFFKAEDIDYKGVWLNYNKESEKFDGKVDLSSKVDKTPIAITLEGEHNSSKLLAQVDATIGKSHIKLKDVVYDLKMGEASAGVLLDLHEIERHRFFLSLIGTDLQGDFNAKGDISYKREAFSADLRTKSLGGELVLSYKDEALQWKAKRLSLEKIGHFLKRQEQLSADIDTQGRYSNNGLQGELRSNLLQIDKTKIEDITLNTVGSLEALDVQLQLKTEYATIEKASLQIADLKTLSLEANLTTPYTSSPISLQANASYAKELSTLSLQGISDEFRLVIPKAVYKNGRVDGNYSAEIEPALSTLKDSIHLNGDFSYEKVFQLLAVTKDLGGLAKAELKGKSLKLDASKMEVKQVLQILDQPVYARGKLDAKASGTFDGIDFILSSERLYLEKDKTGVDENMSVTIKGRLTPSEIRLLPVVKNRYIETDKGEIGFVIADKKVDIKLPLELKREQERLALRLKSQIELAQDVKGHLVLEHLKDTIRLNDLSYKDKRLQTAINLDIKELQIYNKISKQELYGPLAVSGKFDYKDDKFDLALMTESFGGKADLRLRDKDLFITLENLLAVNIGKLLKKEGASKQGSLNGILEYDLADKKGDLVLSAKDVTVKGIDIDKSLKELSDVLGLNIFAMGETLIKKRPWKGDDINLTTEISHAEFDVTITPELIISKDIALATKNNRFAVNTSLKHDGEIKDFEVAILDLQGCAILTQKVKGNISDPKLVGTEGTAVVILAQTPEQILKTGGKIIDAGADIIDSAASFLWTKGLRQDSKVTLVSDTFSKGRNVFSSGKKMLVSGKCAVYYKGKVKHPK
jgi:hypothetical protein